MPRNINIILKIWAGDFGVPSVDPELLAAWMILRMQSINTIVQQNNFLWFNVPSLKCNNIIIKGPQFLSKVTEFSEIDEVEDNYARSMLIAYKNYFVHSFVPLFIFETWLNEQNYEHTMKKFFKNIIPFPFNCSYLSKQRQGAEDNFDNIDFDKENVKMECYEIATTCLNDFELLLNDNQDYLLGSFPSSLDAIVYSYLKIAISMPLPDPQFQQLIKKHKKLIKYVSKMTFTYFPDVKCEYKYVQPVDKTDFPSTSTIVTICFCVTAAFLLYSYSKDIGPIK